MGIRDGASGPRGGSQLHRGHQIEGWTGESWSWTTAPRAGFHSKFTEGLQWGLRAEVCVTVVLVQRFIPENHSVCVQQKKKLSSTGAEVKKTLPTLSFSDSCGRS